MPAFHLVSFARRVLKESNLYVVFDDVNIPEKNTLEQQVFEAEFADVPKEHRLSRKHDLPGITCFKHVILNERMANPEVKMTAYAPDLAYLRGNVEKRRNTKMHSHCKQLPAEAKKTIWLAQRRVYSRKLENIEDIVATIKRVFGDDWTVHEFDSVNAGCPLNGKTCLGYYNCDLVQPTDTCTETKSLDKEIDLFNSISFLIAVHGATAMNLPWMPDDSTYVELFPPAFNEPCYSDYARRSPIEYYAFNEPNYTRYNAHLSHVDPKRCFADPSCRHTIKEWSVHISVDALEPLLREAKQKYFEKCAVPS